MPRYKLTLEYAGTGLVGWQRQPTGNSVQEILETAFERFVGPVFVQGAGRTDAGVHASGQAAHVDLDREIAPHEIMGALNFHVRPHAVSVLAVEAVDDTFHARLSATRRSYLYRVMNRRAPPALDRDRVWHVAAALDTPAMAEAARHLLGHHDFTTFRARFCQARSPLKTLDRLDVTREGDEVRIVAEARSFLYHQVRNMVGTLRLVGAGQWRPGDVAAALAARDRAVGGPTAPPEGLCLTAVSYAGSEERARRDPVGDGADGEAEEGVE
ncbi:MAG TPA: tRNA pseudouridine(38-40) synthase TruA [Stellaceae bacterium]|nr:tRNA pseudouridine(38-40) synthase TruA [Stellaceae bacterium]